MHSSRFSLYGLTLIISTHIHHSHFTDTGQACGADEFDYIIPINPPKNISMNKNIQKDCTQVLWTMLGHREKYILNLDKSFGIFDLGSDYHLNTFSTQNGKCRKLLCIVSKKQPNFTQGRTFRNTHFLRHSFKCLHILTSHKTRTLKRHI